MAGNRKGHALRIAIVIAALLLIAGGANAATITVDDSGGADYARIQDAIDNASAGDTILVYSGTYYENVKVTKRLVLRGIDNGGGIPVVDATGNGSAIMLSSGWCILEGFTAINASWSDAGIHVNSNNNIIRNNTADSNKYYGIYIDSYINNNTLSDNNASNNYIGILLSFYSSSNLLSGNSASNNYELGIELMVSNNNTLTNNIMTMNKYNFNIIGYYDSDFDNKIDTSNTVDGRPIYYIKGGANTVYDSSSNAGTFYCISCVNVTLKNMSLNRNGAGIVFWNTTSSRIQNVNALSNWYGIYLASSSNNMLSGNNVSGWYGISLDLSNNNTLSGNIASNNNMGIALGGSGNNTLSGNDASNNGLGISLEFSSNNTLIGNNASNNYFGIFQQSSSNSMLTNNTMTGNEYNFWLLGSSDSDFDNKIDVSNIADGKFIYYLKSKSNTLYDSSSNSGTFYCISCVNVTLKNMSLNKNGAGIVFWNTTSSRILNVNASKNLNGIVVMYSTNNTLLGNIVSNNSGWENFGYGIILSSSSSNLLSSNSASNNYAGGIHLVDSSNNRLIDNIASNNSHGIGLFSSTNNTIYNNFFNNTDNIDLQNSVNNWNNTKTSGTNIIGGSYIGGNFWANPSGIGFSQTCVDSNSDGICDSPYMIDSSNIDYLPLAYNRSSSAQLKGDVSGDGQVSVVDALFIAQYTVGTRALTSTQLAAADVNGDGQVTIVDALFIAQYTVGLRQL